MLKDGQTCFCLINSIFSYLWICLYFTPSDFPILLLPMLSPPSSSEVVWRKFSEVRGLPIFHPPSKLCPTPSRGEVVRQTKPIESPLKMQIPLMQSSVQFFFYIFSLFSSFICLVFSFQVQSPVISSSLHVALCLHLADISDRTVVRRGSLFRLGCPLHSQTWMRTRETFLEIRWHAVVHLKSKPNAVYNIALEGQLTPVGLV